MVAGPRKREQSITMICFFELRQVCRQIETEIELLECCFAFETRNAKKVCPTMSRDDAID